MIAVKLKIQIKLFIITIISRLENEFGHVDAQSEEFPFYLTTYYEPEMGDNLLRSFLTFDKLVSPAVQAEIKLKTNEIEAEFTEANCRKINLDPGLLTAHNLILTTGKDFSHRIYIRDGINSPALDVPGLPIA